MISEADTLTTALKMKRRKYYQDPDRYPDQPI